MLSLDDAQPVEPDEEVLRRIPNNDNFYEDRLPIKFARAAFRPHEKRDLEGLSVYRNHFVSPDRVALHGRARGDCFVVCLRVDELEELGLSVIPAPDPEQLPGHALIPELSYPAYKKDKNRGKTLTLELARIASRSERIVFRPGDARKVAE